METHELIRLTRNEKGLTQKELGVQLGVSESRIAQYESGKCDFRMQTLKNIAYALGVTPCDLLGADWFLGGDSNDH